MFETLRIAVCVTTTLLVSIPAFAQNLPGANDPDVKEIAAYELTVAGLNKVLQATKNIEAAAKNDPRFQKQVALRAEIKKIENKEEPTDADQERLEKAREELETMREGIFPKTDNRSLTEMAAAIEKEPAFARAISSAGLTPREYAKFLFAYMTSGMVAGMMEQGVIKEVPKELAGSVNPANIKFHQAHKAELQAFQKAMESLNEP